MKKIVYTRPDGGLSVVHPAPWARLVRAVKVDGVERHYSPSVPFDSAVREYGREDLDPRWAETEDQFLRRIRDRSVPIEATAVRVVDAVALPAYDEFRDAWRLRGDAIAVDMPAAREIKRAELRRLREPLLEALDVGQLRAQERGGDVGAIAARKQALRDVTADPAIEAATTPEALRAVMPAALKA